MSIHFASVPVALPNAVYRHIPKIEVAFLVCDKTSHCHNDSRVPHEKIQYEIESIPIDNELLYSQIGSSASDLEQIELCIDVTFDSGRAVLPEGNPQYAVIVSSKDIVDVLTRQHPKWIPDDVDLTWMYKIPSINDYSHSDTDLTKEGQKVSRFYMPGIRVRKSPKYFEDFSSNAVQGVVTRASIGALTKDFGNGLVPRTMIGALPCRPPIYNITADEDTETCTDGVITTRPCAIYGDRQLPLSGVTILQETLKVIRGSIDVVKRALENIETTKQLTISESSPADDKYAHAKHFNLPKNTRTYTIDLPRVDISVAMMIVWVARRKGTPTQTAYRDPDSDRTKIKVWTTAYFDDIRSMYIRACVKCTNMIESLEIIPK